MVKVCSVKNENSKVQTIYFKDKLCTLANPGQFIMVWIPRVDEIPLSLSSFNDRFSSVTVKDVGEATKVLNQTKIGDIIGIRGPFGNNFQIMGKKEKFHFK